MNDSLDLLNAFMQYSKSHIHIHIHTYLCRANDEQKQTTKSPNANGIHAGAGAGPLESSPSCRVPRSHLPCLLVTENTNGRGLREQGKGTVGGNGNGNVNGVVLQERSVPTVGQ